MTLKPVLFFSKIYQLCLVRINFVLKMRIVFVSNLTKKKATNLKVLLSKSILIYFLVKVSYVFF